MMELMQASLFDVIHESSFAPYANWDSAFFSIVSDVAKGMSFIHFNRAHLSTSTCCKIFDVVEPLPNGEGKINDEKCVFGRENRR